MNAKVIFDSEAEARAACNERNQAGGFYRVVDLVKDPQTDFPDETGFLLEWDLNAAAAWRAEYLRAHFPPHLQSRQPATPPSRAAAA